MSRTADLASGEIFSGNVVDIAGFGNIIRLDSTVSIQSGVVIASPGAKARVAHMMKAGTPEAFDVSLQGVRALIDRFELSTQTSFARQQSVFSRGRRDAFHRFPFAWSIAALTDYLDRGGSIRYVQSALINLKLFNEAISCFPNHPRFKHLLRGIAAPNSFHHNCTQILLARYLQDAGNEVGISIEDNHSSPNPDLYFRGLTDNSIFYMELKTPISLRPHPDSILTIDDFYERVVIGLKKARRQISSSHRGIITLAYFGLDTYQPDIRTALVRKALYKIGQDGRNISAAVFCYPLNLVTKRNNGKIFDFSFSISIDPQINPGFEGYNPIISDPSEYFTDNIRGRMDLWKS